MRSWRISKEATSFSENGKEETTLIKIATVQLGGQQVFFFCDFT